ncbi:MAG: hypothetical protein NTZ19_06145 [Bacteroidetes bacterium]|nr:hypothetical protein [Bacteroidota bacterium]
MQKLLLISLLFFVSCNSNNVQFSKAENAFDAGREFIDGTLKGDFKKAAFYMLTDSINQQFLAVQERDFRLKDKEGRQQLRTSSINIQQVEDLDSIVSIIHYNNSFDKINQSVKVIKQNNNWLVDYKYSFQKK